jgi:hypothetical protein
MKMAVTDYLVEEEKICVLYANWDDKHQVRLGRLIERDTDGRTGRQTDGWIEGWIDGWMDGWTEGWTQCIALCTQERIHT